MRMIGFEIKGLFGNKNYKILFNKNPRVTIIFGLNGTGKTTILGMIENILKLNFFGLEEVVFNEFKLLLDSNETIGYFKGETQEESRICLIGEGNTVKDCFYLEDRRKSKTNGDKRSHFYVFNLIDYIQKNNLEKTILKFLERKDSKSTFKFKNFLYSLDQNDPEFFQITKRLGVNDVIQILTDIYINKKLPVPNWILKLRNANPLLFIKSERLVKYNTIEKSVIRAPYIREFEVPPLHYREITKQEKSLELREINNFSNNLKELKDTTIKKYNELSQSLYTTFPQRVIDIFAKNKVETIPSSSVLQTNLIKIKDYESLLSSAGLLTKEKHEKTSIDVASLENKKDISKIISLWIQDSNDKNKIFEELLDNILLFRDIINNHLDEKEIKFDGEEGFYFLVKNEEKISSSKLPGQKLSSGEQHLIVLLYQLIFLVKEESIVLIDEPEISLHTTWQNDFIEDIIKIGKKKNSFFVLATHSPQIVHGRISLTRNLNSNNKL